MKRLIIIFVCLMPLSLLAQLTTAVPFMGVATDARSVAMGETGVATTPDVNALYWNAAKYAFVMDRAGGAVSYAPWMRHLEKGKNLGALNAFFRFSQRHTVAVGGRFFTYGKIDMFDLNGRPDGTESPRDFSVDVAYAFRFDHSWSASVTFHYIHSDALAGVAEAASGFAADLAVYFNRKSTLWDRPVLWGTGLNLSNLGPKLSYGEGLNNNYLPANLRLGGSAAVELCPKHALSLTVELNKFLVPGMKTNLEGMNYIPDESVFEGISDSFADGFASIAWGVGAEYIWNHWLKARAGYHLQHKDWGDRRYFTCGVGAEYTGVLVDVAYRLPASGDSPFRNSWGVTLGYRLKGEK